MCYFSSSYYSCSYIIPILLPSPTISILILLSPPIQVMLGELLYRRVTHPPLLGCRILYLILVGALPPMRWKRQQDCGHCQTGIICWPSTARLLCYNMFTRKVSSGKSLLFQIICPYFMLSQILLPAYYTSRSELNRKAI